MRSANNNHSSEKFKPDLHGVCEKSARSVLSVLRREVPAGTPPDVLIGFAASLTGVMERTTKLLLAGKQVRVIEDNQALTTQEAADLLNVSRPHLVKLLDTGEITPLPKVGRHRRVTRANVLKYKRRRDAQREAALAELAAISQRHKLGY